MFRTAVIKNNFFVTILNLLSYRFFSWSDPFSISHFKEFKICVNGVRPEKHDISY